MFVFSIAYNKIKKQKKKERTFPHFASINRGQFNREIYGILYLLYSVSPRISVVPNVTASRIRSIHSGRR